MSQYYESPIDKAIREAQERGEFDNLPGAGKPLNLGSPSDPDWWIKGLIEREQLDMSAALPSGIRLRREIEQLPETLADVPTEAAVREIVEDLNRRVLADRRRIVDGPTVIAPTVDVEEVVADWRRARTVPTAAREPVDVGPPAGKRDATAPDKSRGMLSRLLRRKGG